MRKTTVALASLLVALIAAGPEATPRPGATTKPLVYLQPDSVDFVALLPAPPAADSRETRAELDLIYALQQARSDADVARAKREEKLSVFEFADVLGDAFRADTLPLTAALFEKVNKDSKAISSTAKNFWNRRRPPYVDARIKPSATLEDEGAYPSGHATRGELFALILADLFPAQADALIARGQLVGFDRVLGGVHYPSDVAAGRVLGQAQFQALMNSPAFVADLDRARREVAGIHAPVAATN